ncbi:MAG: hypothetical protein ABW252_09205 [Polyangiales bacterium]
MSRCARLLFVAMLASCSSDIEPAQPLLNQCTQQFECGVKDVCDPELKLCVRERADAPYPVAFQVVPSEASGALVDRLTLDTQQLQSRLALGEVRVPKAVVLSGRVMSDNTAREATLTFVPRGGRPYLSAPISAQTLPLGGGELRFRARLAPNAQYDVRVYPVGTDAAQLPPHTFEVATSAGDGQVDLTYGGDLRQAFRGKLLDVNAVPQRGRKLRLREKVGGETVSSLGTVEPDGSFVLYTKSDVLAHRSDHELQVGLEARREPWLTSLAVDGARLRPDSNVIVPAIPAPVRFIAGVEVDERASAAVTFRSRFVPPSEQARVNGRDWCRASLDAGIVCTAALTVPLAYEMSDASVPQRPADRRVMVDLIPGDYQVFVRPVNEGNEVPAAGTTELDTLSIESQPDAGAQSGYSFGLGTAKTYSGRVRSPLGKPMPFVTITAQALGLPGSPSEVGEVGRYNRTAEALSDRDGEFRLSVDLGYYDFVSTPPAGSGFAWSLWANRIIDDVVADLAPIAPDAPVIATGTLLTSDGMPIGEARIDAFAVVRDLRTDGQRAVRIGQAVSNDAGVFVLHLPARVLDDPGRDAGMDGGVGDLDAGVR